MAQGRQQKAPKQAGSRRGRSGSRWYNQRPEPEEIATWFKDTVPMHEGMEPSRYVSGLTLIESKDKHTEVGENGQHSDKWDLVLTPYCKVETRVQYFWDLMEMRAPDNWRGIIEPVEFDRSGPSAHLPPGFFTQTIPSGNGQVVAYIGCSMRVRVYDADSIAWHHGPAHSIRPPKWYAHPIIEGPPATKMIPVLTRAYDYDSSSWINVPDTFAMMKAETGAVGRALGLAGMLVVPGTGVATAEDMQEAMSGSQPGESEAGSPATLPDAPASSDPQGTSDPDQEIRDDITAKLETLKRTDAPAHERFQKWAKDERGFGSLDTLNTAQLRGIQRKLQKTLTTKAEDQERVPNA